MINMKPWSRRIVVGAFSTIAIDVGWPVAMAFAFRSERLACHGCGCKGGPGYRAPDGHCVGFRELDTVCGNPPTRCVFENAPGTGENRECALALRQPPRKSPD